MELTRRRAVLLAACALAAVIAIGAAADLDAAPARRAAGKEAACPVAGARTLLPSRAVDGSTFLAADGTEIRLAGVLGADGGGEALSEGETESLRAKLGEALAKGEVTYSGEGRDRYGRILAQVFVDGTWLQGALLRQGYFRAAPDRVSAPCAPALLQAEAEARLAKRGHWSEGRFIVRAPDELAPYVGTFQIVEGTVVTASLYQGRAFVNFGPDYRSDFTVTVSPPDMRAFRQAGVDVPQLAGKRIRVRGWIELYNGPEMEISTPAAIEIVN